MPHAPMSAPPRGDPLTAAPTVSVLVTVHNRAEYLAACLDSILASTWQDFEVVVVDDGSTDESAAIGERYAAQDSRIRFSVNERNLGDYPNRIRAAGLARGRYLKYVDSDDLIYPHGLRVMVEAMDAYPDAGLALSHSLAEDEQPYPWKLEPGHVWRKQFLGDGCLNCGPTGAMMRRDAFMAAGGFRSWGVLSDTDLWYRISARWPVLLLPPALVWWRRHEGQEFTKEDARIVYLERGFALTVEALSSRDCPLSGEERDAALARARQHHARRLLSLAIRERHPLRAVKSLRRSGLSAAEMLSGFQGYW